MRAAIWLVATAALTLGCGGSTTNDTKGSAGTGGGGVATGGTGGSVATGGTGGSVATGGTGGSVATGGSAGNAATGGSGGTVELCCSVDSDCPKVGADIPGFECVGDVCEQIPDPGTCWSDADCQDIPGSCIGGFVCGCAADCGPASQLGKCDIPDQCCTSNQDCVSAPPGVTECVAGNCEQIPPLGQCWTDADCPAGQGCSGACVCPCGVLCACGGQLGWCEGPKP
jgi:hypothetical protein